MSTLVQQTLTRNSTTFNGMATHTTSFNKCLDLFYLAGGSRYMDSEDIHKIFSAAYGENPVLALRILFWARDIRGGAGERKFFRECLSYLSAKDKTTASKIMSLIPEYGRYDDLFYGVEDEAIQIIKIALQAGESLCAKWMPRKGNRANILRKSLGLTPKEYRKLLVKLTNVVETKMCSQEFNKIQYSHVPSKAFAKYRNAFRRKDEKRFESFLEDVKSGDEKINASAIFPNDIIKPYLGYRSKQDDAITQQWNSLPNYMEDSKQRILPVCDVSGSMSGLPMEVSVSLGLYISERNEGIFKDAFITFSGNPTMQYLKGDIHDRCIQLESADWGMNTDIQKTFELILDSAIRANVPNEEMPTQILIISDMEFDQCTSYDLTAEEMIKHQFHNAGYEMPGIVFWNVNGRAGNIPAKADTSNTALVSGFSPSILTSLLSDKIDTPLQVMLNTVNSERYDSIEEKVK